MTTTNEVYSYEVSYPQITGDYDEYVADRFTVKANSDSNSLTDTDWIKRFEGSDQAGVTAWLVEKGCPAAEAERMVARAVSIRPEMLLRMDGRTILKFGFVRLAGQIKNQIEACYDVPEPESEG